MNSRNLSDYDEMFADRPRPLMTSEPGSYNDNDINKMFNYVWNDPDGGTFHKFRTAAEAIDVAADQAARAEAIRAQQAQQARPDAQAQAGATPVAQMNQRYKLEADRVPNCEEIRNYYAYYRQLPNVQDVINKFIANPGPFPPFGGLQQEENYSPVQRAAAEASAAAKRRGGYKSKSKSKSKLKSIKYRKRKSKSIKYRKRKSNRRTMRT